MWALLFLTVYSKESVLCILAKTSKKTFRKWIWRVIPRIAGTYELLVSNNVLLDLFMPQLCINSCSSCCCSSQIKWSNRFHNDKGRTCKVTVDGTDYSILEQPMKGKKRPKGKDGRRLKWNPKWYSHKYEGPGVRYETAVCIQTGDIVSIEGPFPAGSWPDSKIFNNKLRHMLLDDEMVEADST